VLSILNKVSAKLSQKAILAMNVATQTNKQNPAKVAGAFLKANGLK
jgi:glycine betaine/choline ABC-type transport system substrate-binding protein